jgi:hypothetical protein
MDIQTQINNILQLIRRHTHDNNETPAVAIKNLAITEYDNGSVATTYTIDWTKAPTQYVTLTGNTTFIFIGGIGGTHYTLHVAGAFTPTFPASVRWTGGTTPAATATAGHKDIYTLIYSGKESLYDILQSPNYAIT